MATTVMPLIGGKLAFLVLCLAGTKVGFLIFELAALGFVASSILQLFCQKSFPRKLTILLKLAPCCKLLRY
jgi:hypothetical protein